jgi:hypothetical protein
MDKEADMKKYIWPGLVALMLTGAGQLWACSAAGPDKHVGPVTAVDQQAGTFTILDAEKRTPITFVASKQVLSHAAAAKGSVIVRFEQADGGLVAREVHQ